MFLVCGAYAQPRMEDIDKDKEGTLIVKTVSAESTAYKSFTATAYSLRGRMSNGEYVHYGAIAADPKILPLGTIVHIEGMGIFTVKDTGGAIKSNRIDIWFSKKKEAIKFGRRKIKLRIIKYGSLLKRKFKNK